jgi:hypothetical protein
MLALVAAPARQYLELARCAGTRHEITVSAFRGAMD